MIFIAYNNQGFPVGIVSARNEELAKAYWQGTGIDAFNIKCLENPEHFISLDQHPTGVIPILKTMEIKDDRDFTKKKLIIIK